MLVNVWVCLSDVLAGVVLLQIWVCTASVKAHKSVNFTIMSSISECVVYLSKRVFLSKWEKPS